MKNYIITFLLMMYFIFSCKKNKLDINEFNDKKQIESIVNNIILPKVNKFSVETKKLKDLTDIYVKNTNVKTLENLKEEWKEVSKKYASIYAFDIGKLKEKYMRLKIYNWPSTNHAIEKYIEKKDITEENFKNFGSTTKGIAAIEYLLFSEKPEEIIKKFNTKDLKRKKYLQLASSLLFEKSKEQINVWNSYSKELINKKTKKDDKIDNPFNIIFNGLNNVVHFAKETKVGKPAGLEKSNSVNTEILQAYFSKTSLELIKENIKSVEDVFFNDKIISISDRIKYVTKNDILNNKLKKQFKLVNEAIDNIDYPLIFSIKNDKPKVKKLYDALKGLEVLFISDLSSSLSLLITGTDGDGD